MEPQPPETALQQEPPSEIKEQFQTRLDTHEARMRELLSDDPSYLKLKLNEITQHRDVLRGMSDEVVPLFLTPDVLDGNDADWLTNVMLFEGEDPLRIVSFPEQTMLVGNKGMLEPGGDNLGRHVGSKTIAKIEANPDKYSINKQENVDIVAIMVKK